MRETIGRGWKLLLLIAAAIGTASFFLPFLSVRDGDVTPYRIFTARDDRARIDPVLASLRERERDVGAWNGGAHVTVSGEDEQPPPSRIPYYYLSAIACALAAAIAFARRQLGLFTGLLAVGGGLCAVWGWSRELLIDRRAAEHVSVHVTWGASLLLACGTLAVIAGVGSFVIADPGRKRPRVRVVVDGEAREVEVDAPKTSVPAARLRRQRR